LVQKCIWKKAQNLSADIAEIEIGPVLKICNSFINDYPAAYWRSQPNDKPLKTVKTVVATLVQNDPDRVSVSIVPCISLFRSSFIIYIGK